MDELQFLDNRARIHASAGDSGYALIESVAPAAASRRCTCTATRARASSSSTAS